MDESIVIPILSVSVAVAIAAVLYWQSCLWSRPQRYFVRWLTEQQKELLKQANIPFEVAANADGDDGILIGGRDLGRTLRILKARVVEEMQLRGLDRLHIREAALAFACSGSPELKALNVAFNGNIRRQRFVRDIVRDTLLPAVKKNIVVHVGRAGVEELETSSADSAFHLFLQVHCDYDTALAAVPETLLGVAVGDGDVKLIRATPGSGAGLPIIDTATGFELAELQDNSARVHILLKQNQYPQTDNVPWMGLLTLILHRMSEELSGEEYLRKVLEEAAAGQHFYPSFNADGFRLSVSGFDDRRKRQLESLSRAILLPAVRKDIVVTNHAGANAAPDEDGCFHLHFNSAPEGRPCMGSPERLWGFRLLKREQAFLPSRIGLPVADDAGTVLGELAGSHFYLHSQCIFYGCNAEAALLARLMLHLREEISRSDGADSILENVRNQFVRACQRQFQSTVLPGVTKYLPDEAAAAQKEYLRLLKVARCAEDQLTSLQSAPGEQFGQEFDELLMLHGVVDVKADGHTITIFTSTLFCVHPRTDKRHEIGAFKIEFDTKHNTVNWKNLTRLVRNMNAPHVNPEGRACMGDAEVLFDQLMKKREFVALTQLAIAFVESVNITDSWGRHLDSWPLAD